MKRFVLTFIVIFLLNPFTMIAQNQIEKHQTGGIVFLRTTQLEKIDSFYVGEVGCELWLDQGGCRIYQHGNMLLGFCDRDKPDTEGMITFYYATREEVDAMYKKFSSIADDPPKENDRYKIYHFFAKDPEGRTIEFQYFWE